ncbi:MAG: hypothetical protein ACH350_08460 [Parachlamydiaceae bacterium]
MTFINLLSSTLEAEIQHIMCFLSSLDVSIHSSFVLSFRRRR